MFFSSFFPHSVSAFKAGVFWLFGLAAIASLMMSQPLQAQEMDDYADYADDDFGTAYGSHKRSYNASSYPELRDGTYVTLFAGGALSHSGTDLINLPNTGETKFSHGNDYGGYGGIAYGLMDKSAFYSIRPELEFSLSSFELRDASAVGTDRGSLDFETRIYRVMANGYYDLIFDDLGPLYSLYVGTGLGMAFYDFSDTKVENSIRNHMEPEVVFGYQFMTGVTFAINEKVGINFGYRYFSTSEASIFYQRQNGNAAELEEFFLRTHGVEMGIRYGF